MEQLQKPIEQRKFENFEPPKPKMHEDILTVLEVEDSTLRTETFMASMKRCFVSVGLAPTEEHMFIPYR